VKIALISDIHEDYVSLIQAAAIIEQQKCDAVVCLGDIVGFSVPYYDYLNTRNANACINWVKQNCKYVIAGNHDLFAVRKIPRSKVRHFKFPDNWYQLPFDERQAIAKEKLWLYEEDELSALLTHENETYINQLPEIIFEDTSTCKSLFSHFIYPDLTGSYREFVYSYKDIVKHLKFMKDNNCTLSFVGHMHVDGCFKISGNEIIKCAMGKKMALSNFDWVSIPAISSSRVRNGFLIWDTKNQTIEPVSISKRFKLI